MHWGCPYLKKTTRHWDIEPNQQRGRPSWSNWLTRSCSRLLLLLQTWQYPIPRHPPNPQKLTDHELVTGPEEGVWGGVLRNTKWSWITTPQIYTSMVWHPPKRDIIGTRKLKCRKENHPTRPLQIRCGADTNLLFKASIFCEFLGKIGGDAVMIISQAQWRQCAAATPHLPRAASQWNSEVQMWTIHRPRKRNHEEKKWYCHLWDMRPILEGQKCYLGKYHWLVEDNNMERFP